MFFSQILACQKFKYSLRQMFVWRKNAWRNVCVVNDISMPLIRKIIGRGGSRTSPITSQDTSLFTFINIHHGSMSCVTLESQQISFFINWLIKRSHNTRLINYLTHWTHLLPPLQGWLIDSINDWFNHSWNGAWMTFSSLNFFRRKV